MRRIALGPPRLTRTLKCQGLDLNVKHAGRVGVVVEDVLRLLTGVETSPGDEGGHNCPDLMDNPGHCS